MRSSLSMPEKKGDAEGEGLAMRRMKKKKDGHVPEVINCRGGRPLVTANYRGYADNDTPREKIHEFVDPTSPMFSVSCPCGHYTRFA